MQIFYRNSETFLGMFATQQGIQLYIQWKDFSNL